MGYAGLQQVNPILIKLIIDDITTQYTNGTQDLDTLYLLTGITLGVNFIRIILTAINQRMGDFVASRIGRFLIEKFYRKIFTLPQKYFDSEISGKIMNQLNRGILSIKDFISSGTNFILPSFLQALFTIGILAYYNKLIALLAFSIFPMYVYLSHLSTKKWGKEEGKKNKIDDVNRGRMQEVISNIKLIKTFSTQKSEWEFTSSNLEKSNKIYDKQSTFYHLFNFTRNFLLEGIIIGISYIVFIQTFKGEISLGEMVLILQLLFQIRIPLFGMSFILERIQQAEAGSKEFFDVLNLKSAEDFESTRKESSIKAPIIELENINFKYEDDAKNVLEDISLKLSENKTYALVGHSGAGKTTLINLIMNFYSPTTGDMKLNGKNYNEMNHRDVRDNISLVFQDNELFSSTVRENVAYGIKNTDDEKIIDALKKANAYDFVMELPKKLDEQIGERGVKLSGGQKQRIQIARAIMNTAPILILDEATSSLDAKSEKLVQNALDNLFAEKLVIIIAHRFSTIQNADQIIVLDKGKVVDNGNPGQLAKNDGIYAELLKYQIDGNQKLLDKYELY